MVKKGLLLTLLSLLNVYLLAQSWSWAAPLDGEETEMVETVAHSPDGGWVVGGNFRGSLSLGNWNATAVGGTDAFLAAYGPEQDFKWAIHAGNSENDNINSLTVLPDGDIVCAGSYWFELTLGDTTLQAVASPRALFTARFSGDGVLKWVMQYEGIGLKSIEGIAVLPEGQLALAGYYERTLQLGDSLLTSGTADGTTYCFAALLSTDGQLLWVQQGGEKGATRASSLALLPDNSLVIGGFFDDTTSIAGQQLFANTADRDVFLAAYSSEGEALWAKKAGGVIDEELHALVTDTEGNIYATGYMIGVMKLSDAISIQTNNGNPSFFLLKYNSDGEPLFGRMLGGALSQSGEAMATKEGLVVVAGYYQGTMSVDGMSADAGEKLQAFVIGFNTSGEARWLETATANEFSSASALSVSGNNRVVVAGSFRTSVVLDQITLDAQGNSASFVAQLWPGLTEVKEPAQPEVVAVKVYPNPARDTLYFELPEVEPSVAVHICLYTTQGQLVRCKELEGEARDVLTMQVSGLAKGQYNWIAWQKGKQLGSGIVIF